MQVGTCSYLEFIFIVDSTNNCVEWTAVGVEVDRPVSTKLLPRHKKRMINVRLTNSTSRKRRPGISACSKGLVWTVFQHSLSFSTPDPWIHRACKYDAAAFADHTEKYTFDFVLRKNGSTTKKTMKHEETEQGDCGPPTQKVFLRFCRTLNQVKWLLVPPRRRKSNALAGHTTGPSSSQKSMQTGSNV